MTSVHSFYQLEVLKMSACSSKTAGESDFDAVMETGCKTGTFKFQWTVKDLNKYPTKKYPYGFISSPDFSVLKSHSCKFELTNLRGERGFVEPTLTMHYCCSTTTYITLCLSFSDTSGEVLFEKEEDLKFDYNRKALDIEIDELAHKISKLSEDILIMTGEMKIAQIQSNLQTFKDRKV